MQIPSEPEVANVIGHQFPGGTYLVEHWENFLLTECTGATLLPDGIVHPLVLFHLPIVGAGTSIKEMFSLGQAASDYSINIESYDWEMFDNLLEEVSYQVSGAITSVNRFVDAAGITQDRICFEFDIQLKELLVARTKIIWLYARGRP
ncbi:MAG: hypothetical protein ACI9CE_003886 [Flavobacterium sp.]|jgi:hypothetical protein